MPTEQPSNVNPGSTPAPREEARADAVMADDRLDTMPGGGGLGGASAADPLADRAPEGTSRGAPIDVPTPPEDESAKAQAEAALQAAESAGAEPPPSSQ